MDGNSTIKLFGLLLIIIVGVFIWLGEIFGFSVFKNKDRWFWLKIWLTLSVIIGVLFWVILIFWENKHFK